MRLAPLVLALAIAAPSVAHAGTPINQTRPLAADGRLEIENVKGRIDVRAWDRAEVRITGTLGEGTERLEIEGDGESLAVRVRHPRRTGLFSGGNSRSEPTLLRLDVPRRVHLAIDSVAADVDVEGLAAGSWEIDSVSGDVRAVGAPRKVALETVSGDIDATINSSDTSIATVSGDARVGGRLDGEVELETVSGDIRVASNPASRLRRASGNSVSGDIVLQAALAGGARVDFESVSGDVVLRVPASTSAQVNASSFSGTLAAPGARVERNDHGPGSTLRMTLGSGFGEIDLETFSGDARIEFD